MKSLTKQHLKRLKQTTPTVSVWNGTFKRVVVKAKCNKRVVELSVDVTHPLMMRYRTGHREVEVKLVEWFGCNGYFCNSIPTELDELIKEMTLLGMMPLQEAITLNDQLRAAIHDFQIEMGFDKMKGF